MGIGGALIWPAVLGMTYAALPESKAGLAGGLIIGAAGFGNAAGPLIGGALTEAFSWRAVLFLNVPVAGFASFIIWRYIHQPRPEAAERGIDYRGIVAISIGLTALLVALDQAPDFGWGDPRVIVCLALAAIFLIAFPLIERRAGSIALVPRDVIANVEFRSACVAVLFMSATFFAALLYLPQFMQKILDYSPLEAGLGLLPMMFTFALVSFAAGGALQPLRRQADHVVRCLLLVRRAAADLVRGRGLRVHVAGAGHVRARASASERSTRR